MQLLINILAMLGGVTVGLLIYNGTEAFFEWLKVEIRYRKQLHRNKHLFDKEPVAKCYCLNCDYWTPKNDGTIGSCDNFTSRWTASHQFCSEAIPMSKDSYEWRKIRENERKND